MTVNCYQYGVLTSVLEHGELHVHFPDNVTSKPCWASMPCWASWRTARCTTYQFDVLDLSEDSDGAS